MPSARVFWLLALATVLVVVAAVAPALAPAALVLDGAIVLAFAVDLLRLRGVRLEADRRWPPLLVQGAEAEVSLVLTASGAGSHQIASPMPAATASRTTVDRGATR